MTQPATTGHPTTLVLGATGKTGGRVAQVGQLILHCEPTQGSKLRPFDHFGHGSPTRGTSASAAVGAIRRPPVVVGSADLSPED